jgi:hypothetical protein
MGIATLFTIQRKREPKRGRDTRTVIQTFGPSPPDPRSLDARLFSFHEDDGNHLQSAQQALGRASLRAGNPNVDVVAGGVFVPSAPDANRLEVRAGKQRSTALIRRVASSRSGR